MIWWSLLGSYVCLITTQWTTVDVFIAEDIVQLVDAKLLLLVGEHDSWLTNYSRLRLMLKLLLKSKSSLHSTVQFLKYVPAASIIGWQVREPGIHDLWWGSLLQCSWQLEQAYILGPFKQTRCHLKVINRICHYREHVQLTKNIYRMSIGRIALMFSFYIYFNIDVLTNIWWSINLPIFFYVLQIY